MNRLLLNFLFTLLCFSIYSYGETEPKGVFINKTRLVVINGENKNHITINNSDSKKYLVKLDVTVGTEINSAKNNMLMPTPPIFYLDGNESQIIKIINKNSDDNPLESLSYLSVLAIPISNKDIINNDGMSVGFRHIIKVLLRSKTLDLEKDNYKCQITFSENKGEIVIINSTPLYFTISDLSIGSDFTNLLKDPVMISPDKTISIKSNHNSGKVRWKVINDKGIIEDWCESSLSH